MHSSLGHDSYCSSGDRVRFVRHCGLLRGVQGSLEEAIGKRQARSAGVTSSKKSLSKCPLTPHETFSNFRRKEDNAVVEHHGLQLGQCAVQTLARAEPANKDRREQ